MQPHECIKMTLVGGPLNKLDGSWKFEYISDSSSRIILQIDYEVTSYVYATVFDTVIATVSEQILLSFEKRAASIYG